MTSGFKLDRYIEDIFCAVVWPSVSMSRFGLISQQLGHVPDYPVNIHLFKVNLETLEKGVKYVQS